MKGTKSRPAIAPAAEPLMTVKEAAEYFRVCPMTIYRELRAHRLPALRIGNVWRFNRADLDRWCERRQENA